MDMLQQFLDEEDISLKINSYMKSIREFNERAAMNMPIQGSIRFNQTRNDKIR